mmetsp:Transcript_8192/g.16805  ORF Transcript_8192/g.16805 Transcript_8192/m.16805 type:complete len:206 (+) Transcript_8192:896-1513(+)
MFWGRRSIARKMWRRWSTMMRLSTRKMERCAMTMTKAITTIRRRKAQGGETMTTTTVRVTMTTTMITTMTRNQIRSQKTMVNLMTPSSCWTKLQPLPRRTRRRLLPQTIHTASRLRQLRAMQEGAPVVLLAHRGRAHQIISTKRKESKPIFLQQCKYWEPNILTRLWQDIFWETGDRMGIHFPFLRDCPYCSHHRCSHRKQNSLF